MTRSKKYIIKKKGGKKQKKDKNPFLKKPVRWGEGDSYLDGLSVGM